jgi:hypothetical protein
MTRRWETCRPAVFGMLVMLLSGLEIWASE